LPSAPAGRAASCLRAHADTHRLRRAWYGGPCPPEGDHPHRYLFTVFAVKTDKLDVKADTSAAVVGFNLHFNTLARAEIMGLFKR
jgi:Raf kinase inhibitor-like YbhB/YbcL family protein